MSGKYERVSAEILGNIRLDGTRRLGLRASALIWLYGVMAGFLLSIQGATSSAVGLR
jgi:hypothetical protein